MVAPPLDFEEIPVPKCLEGIPDALWIPNWWEMDGGTPRVYAVNLEKSAAANRVLMDDAY